MTSTLKKSLQELSQASNTLGVMPTVDHTPIHAEAAAAAGAGAGAALRLFAFSGGGGGVDSSQLAQLARDSRDLDVIMTSAAGGTSTTMQPQPQQQQQNQVGTNPPQQPKQKSPTDILQEEMDGFMDAAQKGKLQEFFDFKQSQHMESILFQYDQFAKQQEQSRIERQLLQESTKQIDEALFSSTLVPGRALSGISSSIRNHIQQQQQQGQKSFPARNRSADTLIWNEVFPIHHHPSSNTITSPATTSTTQQQQEEKVEQDPYSLMTAEQEIKYISSQSTALVAKHLELLLSLKEPPTGKPSLQDLNSMLEEYQSTLKTKKDDGNNATLTSLEEITTCNAYLNAIRLLQRMFHREFIIHPSSSSITIVPGQSPSFINSKTYSGISKNNQILYRAMGALQYLGELFGEHIVNRVKQSSSSSTTRSMLTSFRQQEKVEDKEEEASLSVMIKKYVELELGRDIVARGGNAVVYRCLYYCLRSGDACAAHEIIENYLDIDVAVRNIIFVMAKGQSSTFSTTSNASSLMPAFDDEINIVPIALRNEVADQYRRLKTRYNSPDNPSSSTPVDEYQLACFALLSLEENLTAAGTKSIILTIEDYIFANLWWAIHLPKENQPSVEIHQLGDNIKTWGADYFEGTVGWSYALPLLLTQQFYTAMTHLASTADQGLLIATHLSLALTAAGATVTDVITDSDDSETDFLRSIVFAYAEALQSISPCGALRYLVCISRDTATDSFSGQVKSTSLYARISQIIICSRCFEGLIGFVNADGSRMPSSGMGGLDTYFSRKEVSEILELAAEETRRNGHVADSAELLMLSERYGSLLGLLCRQLSSLVGVEEYNVDERHFWRSAAKTFYYIYLDKGRTYVVQTLEKEGRMSLKKCLNILLQLFDSFDYHRDGLWQSCWDTLDKLEFFPRHESEMALKVSSFYSLDGEIIDIFHGVILIGMEALYQLFMKLRSSFVSDSPAGSAILLHLSEIRHRVKLLVTFTGLIQFRNSNLTKMRISQMEVCII